MAICFGARWDVVAPAAAAYLIVGMASSIAGHSFAGLLGVFGAATLGCVAFMLFDPGDAIFLAIVFALLGICPFAAGVLAGRVLWWRRQLGPSAPRLPNLLVVPALVLGALIVHTGSDLRRRSDASIRAALLRETPIGSTKDAARAAATSRGWQLRERSGSGPSYDVVAYAGEYWGMPFEVSVTVTWIFDGDEQLRDVRVKKEIDGL